MTRASDDCRSEETAVTQAESRNEWYLVLVAAAIAGLLLGCSGGGSKRTAPDQSGRLYLTPTALDGRFRLVDAGINGVDPSAVQSTSTVRSFGRRAPDGIALAQSIVLSVTPLEFLDGTEAEPKRLRILGEDMVVRRDSYGFRRVAWRQTDGQTVAVTAFGVSDDALVAVSASARSGPAATTALAIPAGFVPGYSGPAPMGPVPGTFQRWESANGDSFEVGTMEMPGTTIEAIATELPGGHAVDIRATTAIFTDRDGAMLNWIERPDVRVMVSSATLDEGTLRDIAAHLRVVDEPAWQRIPADRHLPTLAGPREAAPAAEPSASSYLILRPVLRRTQPPCVAAPAALSSAMVAQTQAGQEFACLEVGPPALTAPDVATASVKQDGLTGLWQVDVTLTPGGAARFESAHVAPGQAVAIIVDGRVVSTPVLLTPSPPVVWTLTGLDEKGSLALAERLGA
jgi:hypothetical protein